MQRLKDQAPEIYRVYFPLLVLFGGIDLLSTRNALQDCLAILAYIGTVNRVKD